MPERSRAYAYFRDALGLSDEVFSESCYAVDSVNIEKTGTGLYNRDVKKLRVIVGDVNVLMILLASTC